MLNYVTENSQIQTLLPVTNNMLNVSIGTAITCHFDFKADESNVHTANNIWMLRVSFHHCIYEIFLGDVRIYMFKSIFQTGNTR